MTSHLSTPTGEYSCEPSTGCGARCFTASIVALSPLPGAAKPETTTTAPAAPASPAPDAALPGGCVLGMGTARSDDEHGYLVHSASGKWWWDIEGKKWKKLKAREWAGIYARAEALANPPSAPPPDYTPAPSKPESVDAERPTTETLDWRDEIYQTALRVADVDRSALRIVKGLPTVEAEARNDVRSSPAYWNGDDWESISGSHDAREWMDQQLAQYVSKEILKLLNPPL